MAHSLTRILIVEDNALLALEMEALVEDLGYWVIGPIQNLQDGLDHARADDFEFALLDFDLGHGTDATPIAEALSARGIPFAFTTGSDPGIIRKAFGVATIIAKPVSEGQLMAVLPH